MFIFGIFPEKIPNFHFSVFFDEFVYFWNFPGKFRFYTFRDFFGEFVRLGILPENLGLSFLRVF